MLADVRIRPACLYHLLRLNCYIQISNHNGARFACCLVSLISVGKYRKSMNMGRWEEKASPIFVAPPRYAKVHLLPNWSGLLLM